MLEIVKEKTHMTERTNKSTSLRELGYRITADHGKDEKGNEFVFKVTGPTPVFYIKQTKRGRLIAVKSKDAATESTIHGLYNFKLVGEGQAADLVGVRVETQSTKTQSTKTQPEQTTQAA